MKQSIGDIVADRFLVRAHIPSDIYYEKYEVLDLSTRLSFNLQICHPIGPTANVQRQNLERKASAALSMTHENIAPVYAVGRTENGALYVLLDSNRGLTLRELLTREPQLPIDQALSVLVQIAQALSYAHQTGHLHGHLTPADVQITEGQHSYQAKVTNFGMDELTNAPYVDGDCHYWQGRRLWWHAHYVSPEQCRFGSLSAQTDIYSFGCIMFQMLAGHPPFQDKTAPAVLWKQISENIPLLPETLPGRNELQKVLNCCLTKDPSKRYDSAIRLASDLDRIQNSRSEKGPLLGGKVVSLFARRAIATNIGALLSLLWHQMTRSRRVFL